MNKRPGVGIGVFVLKNGKFLMAQRFGAHGHGTWSLPGGHLEFGESFEDCAAREVLEETGLHVNNQKIVTTTNDFDDDRHYVTVWIKCDWVSGLPTVTEPDKFKNFKWHTLNDLPHPLFQPYWQNFLIKKVDLT